MRDHPRASSTLLLSLYAVVTACGADTELGLPQGGAAEDAIVGGTKNPTAIALTNKQRLALAAVLFGSDDDGWSNQCSATLVTPTVALTAAHCLEDWEVDEVALALGADAADPVDGDTPSEIHVHPSYDPDGDARHDIAVLIFETAFSDVTPLAANCSPLSVSQLVGERVQIAGFGETDDDANNTERFFVASEVTDLSTYDITVDGAGGGGPCFGDSGGPALFEIDGEARVIGTLSWGDAECGYEDYYTRVDHNCAFLRPFLTDAEPSPTQPPAAGGGSSGGGSVAGGTYEGVSFTTAQATTVLDLCNDASLDTLDVDVGLDRRAAENIIAARPITSVAQLAQVAYVGPAALTRLRDYDP